MSVFVEGKNNQYMHVLRFFCLSFQVAPGKRNYSTAEFVKFKQLLVANAKKAENIRVSQHLRFKLLPNDVFNKC